MVDLDRTRREPIDQFFHELGRVPAGLLGVEGSRDPLQPMAPMIDEDARRIYFFTKTDTDLARLVGSGARARYCVVGKDQDYHACVSGSLAPNTSRDIVDRYWGPVVSAWFEGGKDDPKLVVLEFAPAEAAIWASTGSTLKFGWEIAKANMTDSEPDVGLRTDARF